MSRVVLASRNAEKLTELRRILEPLVEGIEVLGLDDVSPFDEPAETEPTFEGNALLKARACLAATGLPSLADDSGLCVDALNGMPGVLSARWCGRHGDDRANLDLVLGQLADVPDERRGAAFVCAAALVQPDGAEVVAHGEWRGRLRDNNADEAKADTREQVVRSLEMMALAQVQHALRRPDAPLVKEVVFEVVEAGE